MVSQPPSYYCLITGDNDCRAALEWYKLTGQVPSGTVVNLPFSVGSMHAVSENQWLLTEFDSPRYVCTYISVLLQRKV